MKDTTNNCPICGKAGLPDFRREEVVCPACNTDLKAYQLLHETVEGQKEKNKRRTIYLFIIPCFLLAVCFFYLSFQIKDKNKLLHNNKVKIETLNRELETVKNNLPIKGTTPSFVYTIKNGDSFCLISQKIFGTEKHAQTIAKENNMEISSRLVIGNKLIITQK